MTVAASASPGTTIPGVPARLELAWTVSAQAADGGTGYASAVLHVQCEWSAPAHAADDALDGTEARVRAIIDSAGARRIVSVVDPCCVRIERDGAWTHVDIVDPESGAQSAAPIVRASFEHGRLVYCVGAITEQAGLPGGTYDAPTGILELYELRRPAAKAS